MILYSLLLLILSNAVTSRRDKSILYSRQTILILLFSSLIALNNLYISLDEGLGLYGSPCLVTPKFLWYIAHVSVFITIPVYVSILFLTVTFVIIINNYLKSKKQKKDKRFCFVIALYNFIYKLCFMYKLIKKHILFSACILIYIYICSIAIKSYFIHALDLDINILSHYLFVNYVSWMPIALILSLSLFMYNKLYKDKWHFNICLTASSFNIVNAGFILLYSLNSFYFLRPIGIELISYLNLELFVLLLSTAGCFMFKSCNITSYSIPIKAGQVVHMSQISNWWWIGIINVLAVHDNNASSAQVDIYSHPVNRPITVKSRQKYTQGIPTPSAEVYNCYLNRKSVDYKLLANRTNHEHLKVIYDTRLLYYMARHKSFFREREFKILYQHISSDLRNRNFPMVTGISLLGKPGGNNTIIVSMLNPNLSPLSSNINRASRLHNNLYRLAPTYAHMSNSQLRSMGDVYGCQDAVRHIVSNYTTGDSMKTIFFTQVENICDGVDRFMRPVPNYDLYENHQADFILSPNQLVATKHPVRYDTTCATSENVCEHSHQHNSTFMDELWSVTNKCIANRTQFANVTGVLNVDFKPLYSVFHNHYYPVYKGFFVVSENYNWGSANYTVSKHIQENNSSLLSRQVISNFELNNKVDSTIHDCRHRILGYIQNDSGGLHKPRYITSAWKTNIQYDDVFPMKCISTTVRPTSSDRIVLSNLVCYSYIMTGENTKLFFINDIDKSKTVNVSLKKHNFDIASNGKDFNAITNTEHMRSEKLIPHNLPAAYYNFPDMPGVTIN